MPFTRTSTTTNDYSAACPVEILLRVLGWITFADLVRTSHVSKHWRQISRQHPNFSKRIEVLSVRPSTLDRFLVQLRASVQRSVEIHLNVVAASELEILRLVFQALTVNIHRVEQLSIQADPIHAPDVFAVLQHPAPRLWHFCLAFTIATTRAPILPSAMFDNHAPRLREVFLRDVRMPRSPVPAFMRVQSASYAESARVTRQCGKWVDVQRWFETFPAATHVGFRSGLRKADPRANRDILVHRLMGLNRLSTHFRGAFGCNIDFLTSLPGIATVPVIETIYADSATVSELLRHLQGSLQLSLAQQPQGVFFTTTLKDFSTGRERVFGDWISQYLVDKSSPFFHNGTWARNVLDIVIAQSMWQMMTKYLPSFTAATHLTLQLDLDASPISTLTAALPLYAPCLKRVTLHTVFEQSFVDVQDILSFIDVCLKDAPTGLALQLKGPIVVIHDTTLLSRHFGEIVRTGDRFI